uniref:Uncharacterized protein n=1 Tax=Arundo donax TaxID=35708 RepID=A0A0A9A3T5_ARUDO
MKTKSDWCNFFLWKTNHLVVWNY